MKYLLFLRATASAIALGYAMAAVPAGFGFDHGQLSFISTARADDGGSDSSSGGDGSGESSDSGSDSSGSDSGGHDSGSSDSNDDSGSDDNSSQSASTGTGGSSDDSSEHTDPLTKAINQLLQ